MTAYDDMPVGTVLRDNRGTVWVKRYSNGWRRDGATGSLATHMLVGFHSPLVELVVKPAEPAAPTRLVDRLGDAWEERDTGWHLMSCTADCPEHRRTRAEVEADFGPLTEVPA